VRDSEKQKTGERQTDKQAGRLVDIRNLSKTRADHSFTKSFENATLCHFKKI
jgi:hypothetical protein